MTLALGWDNRLYGCPLDKRRNDLNRSFSQALKAREGTFYFSAEKIKRYVDFEVPLYIDAFLGSFDESGRQRDAGVGCCVVV